MTVGVSNDPAPVVALEDAASAIATARRAALADRYAANSLTVEWRPLTGLEPVAAQWRELAARALEPNVFYEPAFALAAAPVFGADAGAVLIWSGEKSRRLLGFFPARIERRRYGFNLPVLGRLDPSLCTARPAAGRARSRRAGHRRVSVTSCRRSRASGIAAVALPAGGRTFRRRARRHTSARADAVGRIRPSSPGASRAERRAVAVSGRRHQRPPAQGVAPAMAAPCRNRRHRRYRSRPNPPRSTARSKTFSAWRRTGGRAGPARQRQPTKNCSASCVPRCSSSPPNRRCRSIASLSTAARSPRRSRYAAATAPGSGKLPMTKPIARFSPGVMLSVELTGEICSTTPLCCAPIPALRPIIP